MANFLTTSGISYYIEDIILSAKREIFLVSPYLKLSKTLFERLKEADNEGKKVHIIYGKSSLSIEQKNQLHSLNNIKLLFFQNLHAKCYANEEKLIISSMNIYEFSEKNNREMGILVEKDKDFELYSSAIKEVYSIIGSAKEDFIFREHPKKIREEIPFRKHFEKENITKSMYPRMIKTYWNKSNFIQKIGFKSFDGKDIGTWIYFNSKGDVQSYVKVNGLGENRQKTHINFKRSEFTLYGVLFTIGNIVREFYNLSIEDFYFDSSFSAFFRLFPPFSPIKLKRA